MYLLFRAPVNVYTWQKHSSVYQKVSSICFRWRKYSVCYWVQSLGCFALLELKPLQTGAEVDLWPLIIGHLSVGHKLLQPEKPHAGSLTYYQFLNLIEQIWFLEISVANLVRSATLVQQRYICVKIFSQKRSSREICQEHLVVKRILYIKILKGKNVYIYTIQI